METKFFAPSLRVLRSGFRLILPVAFLALAIAGCKTSTDASSTPDQSGIAQLPPDFPPIVTPVGNPITPEKAALGRRLFYEKELSVNGKQACASCHQEANAFSDFGRSFSLGTLMDSLLIDDSVKVFRGGSLRNSPTLTNVAYNTSYFWDGRAATLEEQALKPVTNPNELANSLANVVTSLTNDPVYPALFTAAFGDARIDTVRIAQALATFERTLISGYSPYDEYRRGNSSAISDAAKRGLTLFMSDQTNCARCHSGLNLADSSFHSTGLDSSYSDNGRFLITKDERDNGKFKTPSLRNVELTAPYEHDGRFQTLEQVLQHYNEGGRHNREQDSLIKPLHLTDQQIEDIVAFLKSLTDQKFVMNAAFRDPH